MEFSDLKEMSKCCENKSTDKFKNRKEKEKSATPYVNTTFVPDNTSTIQNEGHEYEVLQQTTQLQSIKAQEGGLCERIKKQLIYILLVIQVMLIAAVIVIAVIISSSKSTNQSNQRVDGEWSVWGPWSDCSALCNTGMTSRNRLCSSPKPSNGGDYCSGESAEYRVCNKFACPDQSSSKVDGGWSAWGSWSECSASRGAGMSSRNRSCSNPKPSNGGDHCFGETAEYKLCNRSSCSGIVFGFAVNNPVVGTGSSSLTTLKFSSIKYNYGDAFNVTTDSNVGFTVYNADSSSGTGSNPLKFQSTLYNSDASFNNSTGVFTCIHPGVYFFSATVMRKPTSVADFYCYFMVNNSIISIFVLANDHSNSASYPGSSASIVLRLNKNDTVNLGRCSEGTYMYSDGVSFTGFRISP